MGIDFIRQKRAGHRKAWREQTMLGTADLFRGQSATTVRIFRAVNSVGSQLRAGQRVVLRRTDEGVVVCEGTRSIAAVLNPSADVMAALEQGDGVACATVDAAHPEAGLSDLRMGD
jgi:hypothetical protein